MAGLPRRAGHAESEQGATLVLVAIYVSLLLVLAGLALDFGRGHLLRAQLQTALDAAVLAGSLQAEPWATITVERRRWYRVRDYCWDPEREEWYHCGYHWEWERADFSLTGTEAALVWRQEWRESRDCQWRYECLGFTIDAAWVELPDDAVDVARDVFGRNATWPRGRVGAIIRELEIGADPNAARVTGRATLAMPTTFLRLAGVDEIEVSRSAAAEPVRR